MSEPTLLQKHVKGLAAHLEEVYGTTIVYKPSAVEMALVGLLLEVLGIVDAEKFLGSFSTTLLDRVYLSFRPGDKSRDLAGQVRTLVHEHQHAVQFRRDGISFVADYLTDKVRRAQLEAEAYRCNLEMHFWLTGKTGDAEATARHLVHYGCGDEEIAHAASILRGHARTIEAGGIRSAASKTAIRWLQEQGLEGHVKLV